MKQRIRKLIANLYLLKCLTERELKSRYRGSVLGFFWSFLNPLLYMAVLSIIFGFIVKLKIENYPMFILSGLLPWIFFSTSLTQATNSIVANTSLINKVYLPKELFPFSLILNNLVNFIFSIICLFILLVIFGIKLNLVIILFFLPVITFILTIFCTGICLLFACTNVFFRDLTHLVSIILTLWFYISPIFYSMKMVPQKYLSIYLLNPMATIISIYRDVLLYAKIPEMNHLLVALAISVLIFVFGYIVFIKYDDLYAELI